MNREQLVHDLSAALVERDCWRKAMDDARAEMEAAQSRAWELELKLFEPAAPAQVRLRGRRTSIGARVFEAFATPKRIPEVAQELGLSRQQVQTALARHLRKGRLVRTAWGVYMKEGV